MAVDMMFDIVSYEYHMYHITFTARHWLKIVNLSLPTCI